MGLGGTESKVTAQKCSPARSVLLSEQIQGYLFRVRLKSNVVVNITAVLLMFKLIGSVRSLLKLGNLWSDCLSLLLFHGNGGRST